MQRHILKAAILFFVFTGNTAIVSAAEHVLIPKFGIADWDDNKNHRVNSDSFDFDNDIVAAAGFTYLYKLDNGIAFGAELFGYEKDIVTTANNFGDASTTHLYGVVEKFFNPEGSVKPFIGVGLGAVAIRFDATINGAIDDDYGDSATGLSYEIFTGAEIELSDNLGLTVEYKYFDFDIDDDIGTRNINVKSNGQAVFVGVALHL